MNDFEKLVYEMRSAQINYFRTRSKEVLEQSKQLEKRVDKYLIDKKINQQTSFQLLMKHDATEVTEKELNDYDKIRYRLNH